MAYDATKGALNKQAVAAATLIHEIGNDDDALVHDMVEGETDLFAAIDMALSEIDECDIMAAGLKDHITKMTERLNRVKGRSERLRGYIDQAFQMAEIKSHKFERATISTKAIPPKAIITDEAAIPSDFFVPQPPKLDRAALLRALKDGPVAGAELSNGGQTIQIRRT